MVGADPEVTLSYQGGTLAALKAPGEAEQTYGHEGELLTAHGGPEGEATYEYDAQKRLDKVILPDETTAEIAYEALGRVSAVTVQLHGQEAKTTHFEYSDEPRETIVRLPEEPAMVYDIGADGSILRWHNVAAPPEIESLSGSLWEQRGEVQSGTITPGDQNLLVHAHSAEGIASVQIVANGSQLVEEETCEQDYEKAGTECVNVPAQLVTETENWPAGILPLEVIVTDTLGHTESRRFWVNVPYTPPQEGEAPRLPSFQSIKKFREEFGLDPDLKGNKLALDERIFELVNVWNDPNSYLGQVARASWERWGVPMRPVDVAEMENREIYVPTDSEVIEAWGSAHSGVYAGYSVNNRAGGLIEARFTSGAAGHLAELKAEAGLLEPGRIVAVEGGIALAVLDQLAEEIETAWVSNPSLETRITTLAVSQATGLIEVGATEVGPVREALQAEFGAGAPFTIQFDPRGTVAHTELKPTRIMAGENIAWWTQNGGTLSVTQCTAGPGAYEARQRKSDGVWIRASFLLTAAHCAPVGQEWSKFLHPRGTTLTNTFPIGKVARTGAPGGQAYETDGEAIRLESVFNPLPPQYIFRPSGRGPLAINEAGYLRPHEVLCYSGVATGEVKCGEAVGVRPGKLPGPDGRMEGIAFGGQLNISGDSGAPVWDARTKEVVGILHGTLEAHGSETEKNWATPLLALPGISADKAPGLLNALNAPGGKGFELEVAGN